MTKVLIFNHKIQIKFVMFIKMQNQEECERRNELAILRLKNLLQEINLKIQEKQQRKGNKINVAITQPQSLKGGLLKEYQLQALQWMIWLARNSMSGILADDMGLGKTIQAISYFSYLYSEFGIKGKHLVVAPKNVLKNWQREIKKWAGDLQVVILPATEKERQETLQKYVLKNKFDIIVTTYQGVQFCESALARKRIWQTLVIDEAHCLKNQETVLAHTLRRYRAKFTLLMTGTPLSNNLKELWSLLNFIMPDLFTDQNLFNQIEDSVNEFVGDEEEKFKYQCQLAYYFKKMLEPFMKRRTKNQINLGLKQKKQMTLYVPLTQLQLKMYRNFLKFNNVYGDNMGYIHGRQVQLRKICSHPYLFPEIQDPKHYNEGDHLIYNCGKMKILDKLLQKLISQGHKILIFIQFVILLPILEDYCAYKGYKYCKIDGSHSVEEREEAIKQFDENPDIKLFLISTRAGGIGLNLVSADVVIIYEIDWNPQMDKQAMDRSYRIGQKNNVQVYKLISANTVEERMIQVQKYKLIWDELVIQRGGFASMRSAENSFNKIDYEKMINVGAEDIFKIQENFDDKTIEELISMGQQKDENKMKEIKQKLEKDFEKYGTDINPYNELEKNQTKIKGISYLAEKTRHQNEKTTKAPSIHIPIDDFKLYQHPSRVQNLLYLMKNETEAEKIKDFEDQIRSDGFYDWTSDEYQQFVEANKKYLKTDYAKIKECIPTKSINEIKEYSQIFYQQAEYRLKNGLSLMRKIHLAQTKIEDLNRVEALEETFRSFDDLGGIYLTYTPEQKKIKAEKSLQQIDQIAIARLYFNGVLESGACYHQFQPLIEGFMVEENLGWIERMRKLPRRQLQMKKVIRYWEVEEHRNKNSQMIEKKFAKFMNTYGDQKTYITIDDDSNITERTNRVEAKSVSSNPVPKEKVKNKSKIIKN